MRRIAKARLIVFDLLFFTMFSAGITQATPMYYVFTGEVTGANYTSFCVNGDCMPELQIGEPVAFTAFIDFSRQPDSSRFADGQAPQFIDYFYAQYVSGSSFFPNRDVASFNANFGYGVNSPFGWMVGVRGSLFADAARGPDFGDAPLKLYSPDQIVSQWALGDILLGRELGAWGNIDYRLQLTGITSSHPVPEPSTLLLLGSGWVVLVAVRKRFNSTTSMSH